jgi:hypothetical protein
MLFFVVRSRFVHSFREDEAELRTRLEKSGVLAELKRWATDRIETQRWDGLRKEQQKLPLAMGYLYPVQDRNGRLLYIAVYVSSGMRHRGMFIGKRGFTPSGAPGLDTWPTKQWCDQVWYFDEEMQ